jgi:hypothetical protein
MACSEGWKIVDRYIDTLEDLGNGRDRRGFFPQCLLPLDAIAEDIVGHVRKCEACANGSLPPCTAHRRILPAPEQTYASLFYPAAQHPKIRFQNTNAGMLGF